jgi:hypothetical protein
MEHVENCGHGKGVDVKEISAFKRKASTLHCDNRKDALKPSQESARPHPLQTAEFIA